MEQKSVGKVCAWNNLGLHDATGPARCRMSLHLPASGRCFLATRQVIRTGIWLHFVSSGFICVHSADEEGDELSERLFNDCLSSMVNRPSSDWPLHAMCHVREMVVCKSYTSMMASYTP